MSHIVYKGELTNKLIEYDPLSLLKPNNYCIYYADTNYLKIMIYLQYESIWVRDNECVEPIDLPEEILYRFIALYESLGGFYDAFEAIKPYFYKELNHATNNSK